MSAAAPAGSREGFSFPDFVNNHLPLKNLMKAVATAFTTHDQINFTLKYSVSSSQGNAEKETTALMDRVTFLQTVNELAQVFTTHVGQPEFRATVKVDCDYAHYNDAFGDAQPAAESAAAAPADPKI
jgi:hypothetical protein